MTTGRTAFLSFCIAGVVATPLLPSACAAPLLPVQPEALPIATAPSIPDAASPPLVERAWTDPGSAIRGTLPAHSSRVTEMALSRDGSLLASLDLAGHLRFWQTDRGAHLFTLPRIANEPRIGMALSSSGSLVATLSMGSPRVRIVDVHHRQEIATIDAPVRSFAFSPDERVLALSRPGAIDLYDLSSRAVVRTLDNSEHTALHLAFTPDGQRLVAYQERQSDRNQAMRDWNVQTGEFANYPLANGYSSHLRSTAIVFLDAGKTVALSTTWQLWRFDLATRALLTKSAYPRFHCTQLNEDCDALSIAASPEGEQLAVASAGIFEIYDPARGAIVHDVAEGEPYTTAWAKDGTLAEGGRSGGITIYDGATQRRRVDNVRRPADDDDR